MLPYLSPTLFEVVVHQYRQHVISTESICRLSTERSRWTFKVLILFSSPYLLVPILKEPLSNSYAALSRPRRPTPQSHHQLWLPIFSSLLGLSTVSYKVMWLQRRSIPRKPRKSLLGMRQTSKAQVRSRVYTVLLVVGCMMCVILAEPNHLIKSQLKPYSKIPK